MEALALQLDGIHVRFGARAVLVDASLALARGRVHALVGENGAGKTTLIRVACGLVAPDAGDVRARGRALPTGDPRAAMAAGVGVVHQHFMLVDPLTVAENVALGAEPRAGFGGLRVDRAAVRARVADLSREHGMPVDPDATVESLAVGVRQRVEILKVLYRGATTLLLDEPTAVLSPSEVRALIATIRSLADAGAAVLFVSHKLDEVFAVADDITVLHRGKITLSRPRAELTRDEVARAVVGGGSLPSRDVSHGAARDEAAAALSLESVSAAGVEDLTLAVRAGEVLGVAGVEGNGQRPLAELIAGLAPVHRGRVRFGDADITHDPPAARRRAGLGWVPEDREGRGLFASLSITENLALGDPDVASRGGRLDRAEALRRARAVIERFDVRPPDPDAVLADLSGGNQQKVLLGRELSRALRALVVAQPTRGVDLGASAEIHAAIRAARDAGVAVLLISSELDELRALSDRVAVLRGGRLVATLPVVEATDEALGPLMVGAAAP